MDSSTKTKAINIFLYLGLLSILCLTKVIESKLEVPFQDFATPKPAIARKVYYLQDSCSICEKFRPDFTKIKLPPNETEASITTSATASEQKKTDNVKLHSNQTDVLPENKTELKRVPRESSKVEKEEKPEITILEYEKNSNHDSDLTKNSTWTWQTAFKRIRAKWIEKFDNNTIRKVENKMTATLKVNKTPEGDEKRKFVLEFKKKIGNLTALNIPDEDDVLEENDTEENKKEHEKVLIKRELKQIFLDPVEQPSIVIRSRRSVKNEKNVDDGITIVKNNEIENETLNQPTTTEKEDLTKSFELIDDLNKIDDKELKNEKDVLIENATEKDLANEAVVSEENLKDVKKLNITDLNKKDKVKKMETTKKEKGMKKNKGDKEEETEDKKHSEMNKKAEDTKEFKEEKVVKQDDKLENVSDLKSNSTVDKDKEKVKYEKCRLLIRFKNPSLNGTADDKNSTEANILTKNETLTNRTIVSSNSELLTTTLKTVDDETEKEPEFNFDSTGLLVNIQRFVGSISTALGNEFNNTAKKIEKNPWWKNIRIFTSDPNNTEYWFHGKKMSKESGDKSRTKRSIKNEPFIDMIDMEDIVKLLTESGSNLDITNEKWILIERKVFFDDPDGDDDDELIINLFFKPNEDYVKENSDKLVKTCPAGTFDCNSNGLLCIPNSLRCNGEDNCGNGYDETLNCPKPLFHVIGEYRHPIEDSNDLFIIDSSAQGLFWLGIRILFILLAILLFLYILLLLCRMCDHLRSEPRPYFLIPKGKYVSISGDTIEHKWHPSSKSGFGSRMNTSGSKIREYIYVNNNYGQPQGSTLVSTDVGQPFKRSNNKRSYSTSPDQTDDEYPPLYEDSVKNYGTKR